MDILKQFTLKLQVEAFKLMDLAFRILEIVVMCQILF